MFRITKLAFPTLLLLLFAACSASSPTPPSTSIAATPTVLPTTPDSGTPLPTAVPSEEFPLDPLYLAYVLDGNVYIQNGSHVPVQLTYLEADGSPRFSSDADRLVFHRNPVPLTYHIVDLYSIHTDGTGEKLLVTGSLLEQLGLGYDQFTEIAYSVVVPGTHRVLFGTDQLDEEIARDLYRAGAQPNHDILSVDMDTGEIMVILPPGMGGNFVVSPDGAMLAVQASGHIDVVGIDGRMIRQNLVSYTPSTPYELIPGMFWSQDSTELLVTLPVDTVYEVRKDACNMDMAVRSAWRYPIDGNAGVQIELVPPLIGESDEYQFSPDRNWVLYPYHYLPGCGGDEPMATGLYLANLSAGTARRYESNADAIWSLDNSHFIYDLWEQGMFLGSVDQPPVLIDSQAGSLGWIDSTHYFFYAVHDGSVLGAIGEIDGDIGYFPISVPLSILEDTAREFSFDFIYLDP